MKKILLIVLLATGLSGFYKTAPANTDGDASQLYVIKIHADWCGTCKILEPKLAEVEKELSQEPVRFIILDVTDETNTEQSQDIAAELGIKEVFFRDNKSIQKAGTVAIFDPETKEIIAKLTKNDDIAEMIRKINSYLES